MKNWKQIINHHTFRYIDHSEIEMFHHVPNTAITSFAIDDALATSVSNKNSVPTMRLWVHPATVVLGIPDARLPYIEDGVNLLSEQGYQVMVRNSGGLAVALDESVLNMSLILPDVKHISIYDCYEAMVSFVQYMLRDLTDRIQAYEIVGSYCPGDYDLSINGKKFAGISQRRIKDAAAIQIYLDVNGDTKQRATLIREFYEESIKGEKTKFTYPTVNPMTMASLSELVGMKLSVDGMKSRAFAALKDINEELLVTNDFSARELEVFEKRYEQMIQRNEKIVEMQT